VGSSSSPQTRLVLTGLAAQVVLILSFCAMVATEPNQVTALLAVAASLTCVVVAALVQGLALRLLFAIPSLVFLVLMKGLYILWM